MGTVKNCFFTKAMHSFFFNNNHIALTFYRELPLAFIVGQGNTAKCSLVFTECTVQGHGRLRKTSEDYVTLCKIMQARGK